MAKININLALDQEVLQELDSQKEKQGAMSRTAFINYILRFYLLAVKLEDRDSPLISSEASRAIDRSVNRIKNDLQDQIRFNNIMLNMIWRRLNHDTRITGQNLERLVRVAVEEVDSDAISSARLLKSAQEERKTRIEMVKEQKKQKEEAKPLQTKASSITLNETTSYSSGFQSPLKRTTQHNDGFSSIYNDVFPRKTYND